ncbi:hypothetical protein NQ317_008020 [Molorchus minor]|uniref:DUF5641 domain-containing protein n=1 Tax=Molorchus minor TaxID=1323400 RepID=A0ABQ9JVF4_9CUCU|nr:hypothetical protein NQ317_008020 [Molorchus minor]
MYNLLENTATTISTPYGKSPRARISSRILELHPGADGVSRVATVLTTSGTYKRPLMGVSPTRGTRGFSVFTIIIPYVPFKGVKVQCPYHLGHLLWILGYEELSNHPRDHTIDRTSYPPSKGCPQLVVNDRLRPFFKLVGEKLTTFLRVMQNDCPVSERSLSQLLSKMISIC